VPKYQEKHNNFQKNNRDLKKNDVCQGMAASFRMKNKKNFTSFSKNIEFSDRH